jgi:hypothetical protein
VSKRVYFFIFFLFSTLLQVHRQQPTIEVGFTPPPLLMWD